MDWMVPLNRLDREQVAILNEILYKEGNFFVRGCPGTGKSVILAHAYHEYKVLHPSARVCVLTYTHALIACLKDGLGDTAAEIYTFPRFVRDCRRTTPFDLILVDEAQDMEREWADFIALHARRVVLFGDFGQSIYDERVDVDKLLQTFRPTVVDLKTIYRLTRSLKDLVQWVFPSRVINAQIGRLVADTDIQLLTVADSKDELGMMGEKMRRFARPQKPSAVLFSTRRRLLRFLHVVCPSLPDKIELDDDLNRCLREAGSIFRFLGNGFGTFSESDTRPIVYVMTWHSAKGLDFESVGLPDLSNARMQDSPFYVALTRARRNLILSYDGSDDSGKMEKIASSTVVKKIEGGNAVSSESVPVVEEDTIIF